MKTTPSTYGEDEHFKFRVSAIFINDDKVLVHRAEKDDFWALPGGHVELMEPTNITLKREMKEELGVDVKIDRLVWVGENFYDYEGYRFHEVCLYYLVDIPEDSKILQEEGLFYGEEDEYEFMGEKITLIFKWYPINELQNLRLYPSFLREELKDLPEKTEHIVHEDTEEDDIPFEP